jgi:hypothetical protein
MALHHRLSPHQFREHDRFADLGLFSGREQRQRSALRELAQVSQRFCPVRLLQFGLVAAGELFKTLRVVAVPLPQFRGRRYLLAPLV